MNNYTHKTATCPVCGCPNCVKTKSEEGKPILVEHTGAGTEERGFLYFNHTEHDCQSWADRRYIPMVWQDKWAVLDLNTTEILVEGLTYAAACQTINSLAKLFLTLIVTIQRWQESLV